MFYAMLSLFPIPAANEPSDIALRVLTFRYTQQQMLDFILSLHLSHSTLKFTWNYVFCVPSFKFSLSLEVEHMKKICECFTWQPACSPSSRICSDFIRTSKENITHSVAQMLWTGERQQWRGLRYINMVQVSGLYLDL